MDAKLLKPVLIGASAGLILSYLLCPLFLGVVKPSPLAYLSLVLSGIFATNSPDGFVGRNLYLYGFSVWVLVGAASGFLCGVLLKALRPASR